MNIFLNSVTSLSRTNELHAEALKRLGLLTLRDLLYHFPTRYADSREVTATMNLEQGKPVTLYGVMEKVQVRRSFRGHVPMTEAHIADQTGVVRAIWFNQAYIGKMYPDGTKVKISGTVHEDKKGLFLSNPSIERAPETIPDAGGSLFHDHVAPEFLMPVYRETKGITSNYLYTLIKKAVASGILNDVSDPIPPHVLARLHLPELKEALLYIHFPKEEKLTVAARKRFAFEEIFYMQLKQYKERKLAQGSHAYPITTSDEDIENFMASFSFIPTKAQTEAVQSIMEDMRKTYPMGRLLEGDVGSGKTFVAATVAYATLLTSVGKFGQPLQVAYMAPTEILARQHFESFISYFEGTGVEIGLLTGSGCKKFPSKTNAEGFTDISRTQLLKWTADGRVSIIIGTHALIQKSVTFSNLALVIIDEQHRFGVNQRKALARKTSQTVADHTDNTLLYKDLSYILRGVWFDIKKELGLGHKELVYQNAFEIELKKRNVEYVRERQMSVTYNNTKIGVYQPDFIVDNKVIVEFKSVSFLGKNEVKQLDSYLKGSDYKLGFLVNFGGSDIEIKRYIHSGSGLRGQSKSAKSVVNGKLPHLLSMTATPIPRSLALTMFGDLDLTVIDEMPKDRKRIVTETIPARKRKDVYEHMRKELQSGRQAYVICPRIDEQDEEAEQKRTLKSVKEEARRLGEEIFPEFVVDILHSKMKKEEKEEVMQDFLAKKSDILVATSVVEVGVNVPNATVIVIEHADRFGLAQLHQLRGRVGRSEYQSYCYLFTESTGEGTERRLKNLVEAKNGFELAELDMQSRGIGALMDGKQWGISDLAMEAIRNPKLVEVARREARELIDNDPDLESYPDLAQIVTKRESVHME